MASNRNIRCRTILRLGTNIKYRWRKHPVHSGYPTGNPASPAIRPDNPGISRLRRKSSSTKNSRRPLHQRKTLIIEPPVQSRFVQAVFLCLLVGGMELISGVWWGEVEYFEGKVESFQAKVEIR